MMNVFCSMNLINISQQERRDFSQKMLQINIYLSGNINSIQVNSSLPHLGRFCPVFFYTPCKNQKSLTFSADAKKENWPGMS